jgi:hypothetical protein
MPGAKPLRRPTKPTPAQGKANQLKKRGGAVTAMRKRKQLASATRPRKKAIPQRPAGSPPIVASKKVLTRRPAKRRRTLGGKS